MTRPEKRPPDFPYYFFRIRKLTIDSCFGLNKDKIEISLVRLRNSGQITFDVNKNEIDVNTIKFNMIQTLKDIWERPAEQVTDYQRLNKPYTSVLYTSLDPSAAIFETNLKDKDLFFLIVYKSTGVFPYSDCSNFLYFDGLTEEENLKRYILFYILRNEFTRILPEPYDSQNQYYTAYYISRKFFVHEETQAIQYPSTRSLGQRNFAFWGNIREHLEFVGFRFCYLNKKGRTDIPVSVIADCFWNDKSERFEYFSPYSKESKQVFSDPLLSMMLHK